MTDILTRLAALTANDESSPVPACPFCGSLHGSMRHDDGRHWWHCDACDATGPALSRYSEDDEPCWESRPHEAALIALVQEAAGEIERLRQTQLSSQTEAATAKGIATSSGKTDNDTRRRRSAASSNSRLTARTPDMVRCRLSAVGSCRAPTPLRSMIVSNRATARPAESPSLTRSRIMAAGSSNARGHSPRRRAISRAEPVSTSRTPIAA